MTDDPWAEVERQTLGNITGDTLRRAWQWSGRPDLPLDADGWDGFALAVQAQLALEAATRGLKEEETP